MYCHHHHHHLACPVMDAAVSKSVLHAHWFCTVLSLNGCSPTVPLPWLSSSTRCRKEPLGTSGRNFLRTTSLLPINSVKYRAKDSLGKRHWSPYATLWCQYHTTLLPPIAETSKYWEKWPSSVTSQLGQPCIPPGSLIRVRALTGCGKGGNITSAEWPVTFVIPYGM